MRLKCHGFSRGYLRPEVKEGKPIPRFELDESVDAGYVYLKDRPVDKTREVTEGVIVDYDAQDEAIGVEVLFPALGYTTGVRHHPKSPDASPERLRKLAGSVELTGPAPSHKFLEGDEERIEVGPYKLTDDDKKLLEEMVSTQSQHGEYYVRAEPGQQGGSEIWWLANWTIGKPKEEAVKELVENYEMSEREAEAAWVFCNAFPKRSEILRIRHSGEWGELDLEGEDNPEKVLKLKP